MSIVGEISAVVLDGREAAASDATNLLAGYAEGPADAWLEGRVALAWSGGAQAGIFEDVVVVIDGRLDNGAQLSARYPSRNGATTAALTAEAWRRGGSSVLDELVGDLAGLLLERAAGRLHAFRDLCGGRPLHVAR